MIRFVSDSLAPRTSLCAVRLSKNPSFALSTLVWGAHEERSGQSVATPKLKIASERSSSEDANACYIARPAVVNLDFSFLPDSQPNLREREKSIGPF